MNNGTASATSSSNNANTKNNINSSIVSSSIKNKQSDRRLVEYFVVISSTEVPSKENQQNVNVRKYNGDTGNNAFYSDSLNNDKVKFQPTITSRYPLEDHDGNPLHSSISCFCHPTGNIQLMNHEEMPKVHYFVVTGAKGSQMYGTCLTIYEPYKPSNEDGSSNNNNSSNEENESEKVYLPKCLCILSYYPYLLAFREFLCQLRTLTKSGEMHIPVERYISNFCSEIPSPPPGAFEVQTTINDSIIQFWSPPHNQPIQWVSLPFATLFQCLDCQNVILVWRALMLEQQVLLTSTQLTLLTTCCEIFSSLLFPMKWSHAYIPVLPHFLIQILSAPTPYLCGIDKLNLPSALLDLTKECIVVDLDKNKVTLGPMTPEIPSLPTSHQKLLLKTLDFNAGMVFKEARCLSKSDNIFDGGIHLPMHKKEIADQSWSASLCLMDEAFHRFFTPEESRKNLLNGSESDDLLGKSSSVSHNSSQKNKVQSNWDAVQEAFLSTFIMLLKNYRKFLIYPSKENEGSFGGAVFQYQKFVSAQPYSHQNLLKILVQTQMFDDFVTKRLYGSGEQDVVFFDEAIHKYKKKENISPTEHHTRFSKVTNFFRKQKSNGLSNMNIQIESTEDTNAAAATSNSGTDGPQPLLQSARVHQKLKTIVPPEPCATDLPFSTNINDFDLENPDNVVHKTNSTYFGEGAVVSYVREDGYDSDGGLSVGSSSTQGTHKSAYSNSRFSQHSTSQTKPKRIKHRSKSIKSFKSAPLPPSFTFTYNIFPSTLNPDLYGEPRPLPNAILSEFGRQKEQAVRFRRKNERGRRLSTTLKRAQSSRNNKLVVMMDGMEIAGAADALTTTYTVFFMSFTAIAGKELMKIYDQPKSILEDKNILSSLKNKKKKKPKEKTPPKNAASVFPIPAKPQQKKDDEDEYGFKDDILYSFLSPSKRAKPQAPPFSEFDDDNDDTDGVDNDGPGKDTDGKIDKTDSTAPTQSQTQTQSPDTDKTKNMENKKAAQENTQDEGEIEQDFIMGDENNSLVGDDDADARSNSEKAETERVDNSEKEEEEDLRLDALDECSAAGNNVFIKVTNKESSRNGRNNGDDDDNNTVISNITEASVTVDSNMIQKRMSGTDLNQTNPITPTKKNESEVEPCLRFTDSLFISVVEEARERARAHLGLAFEVMESLRKRGLKADPETYQCLIESCGRCGDTDRATDLLKWMHQDGIVADGNVYSCLVSAFSEESNWKRLNGEEEDLPAWANGANGEMDWNKLRKHSMMDRAIDRIKFTSQDDARDEQEKKSFKQQTSKFFKGLRGGESSAALSNDGASVNSSGLEYVPDGNKTPDVPISKNVMMQIMLGENLLELIYPDIAIDTDNEKCPRCSNYLMDHDVVAGWTTWDSQDYTTKCPYCTNRFVPYFSVQSSSPTFVGSKGPSSPLICQRLSPWVLMKELRSIMIDHEGIENLLRPEWRSEEPKNGTLWWNLVLSFMRYRLPFSFLLQGSFETSLITPTPDGDVL